MLRVAYLNGTKHNYDHDLTKMIGSLIQGSCIVEGLEVSSGEINPGYGFIKAIRNNGDLAYILLHLTENEVVDTSGTKKIRLELKQSHVDDGSLINEDQNNVAEIKTGTAYPSTEHLPLASITTGTITDERVFLKLQQGVNKTGAETITGTKTFASFPLLPATPSTDYQAVHKKYVDDLVTQAGAISRFEALRTLGEDLSEGDTYMIGLGGASVDKTTGTINDMIVGSSAGDLIKYTGVVSDPASSVLRRIREFEIITQGSPTSDLSVYGVDVNNQETLIATTTDSSLTIGTAYTLDIDAEYSRLKFVASASNGTNYYKVKTTTDTIEEIVATQVDHNLETLDSSVWTAFQTLTIGLLSQITDIEFEFQSSYQYYSAEMDYRIKHNGTVVVGPLSNSSGNNSSWQLKTITGLSISVSPGDTLVLEMMTPNNRSSSYFYRSKNFKVTGEGTIIKGHHDRGYEAGQKYGARGNNEYRAIFDGIELTGGSEGTITEGAEGGSTAISPSLLGSVYLDDDGGLTTTKKDIYIGEGKGAEIEIIRARPQTYNEFMNDQGLSLQPGEKEVSVKDTGNIYTTVTAYDINAIAYEVIAPETGTFRFACDLQSGNSSASIYAYMALYINDVYITETNTNLNSYTPKYIDRLVQKGDNIKYRLRTSHSSYNASMDNMVVKTGGYLPDTSYFTVV